MHSSYALDVSDFSVERDGKAQPLHDLWPGGYQPGNRLAIPETGARCRGEVVLSTWNAYLAHVKSVVTYSPRTGVARDADVSLVGNKVVESYVEQAIFSTPGLDAGHQARLRRLRRNLDREEKVPVESYRTLPNPAAAGALLG